MAAGLLVGGEAEHRRPGRLDPGAGPGAHHREQHRVEVLHVDGAAAPQVAVLHLAGERVHRPVVGLGGHDVEVAVQQQRVAVAGAPARHHVGPPLDAFVDLRLQADLGQQRGDVLGGLALARSGPVAVVGGVHADQVAADLDDLTGRVVAAAALAVLHARGHDPILAPARDHSRCEPRGSALLQFSSR